MSRSPEELLAFVLERARSDERIRAVTMEGSRAGANALRDAFSDFDICYYVSDIRDFTRDASWVKCFGEILIMQCPCDWYDEPYDYGGRERFTYLMQFADGNRLDLTLKDVSRIAKEAENTEPRSVLLNKNGFTQLRPVCDESAFFVRAPGKKEFLDIVNEFRWIALYITKGLCRDQLYYAKYHYDGSAMAMFIKMLQWKIGAAHGFSISTGAHGKYFCRYLSPQEMDRFRDVFPGSDPDEIWECLFRMYDFFEEIAQSLARQLGFDCNPAQAKQVRDFMVRRRDAGTNIRCAE